MSTEGEEIQRRVRDGVRETLSAYRIQASAGPMTDDALEQILFRGAHQIMESLSPYPREQRYALLPHVVRFMLVAFLEELATSTEGGKD